MWPCDSWALSFHTDQKDYKDVGFADYDQLGKCSYRAYYKQKPKPEYQTWAFGTVMNDLIP